MGGQNVQIALIIALLVGVVLGTFVVAVGAIYVIGCVVTKCRGSEVSELGAARGGSLLTEECQGVPAEYKKYRSLINAASKRTTLPASLIAAQIHQESSFNPGPASSAGARGLMQLMPATYGDLNSNTNWSQFHKAYPDGKRDIMDDAYNVFLGTQYLKQMQERFAAKQKVPYQLALAAYNAGPGRVEDAHFQVPPIDETQKYVKNILGTLWPLYQKCEQSILAVAGTRIYLHWTAGNYDAPSDKYTYTILRGGVVKQMNGDEHTLNRNPDSIGIAIAAMAGCNDQSQYNDLLATSYTSCQYPPTQAQIDAMVELAAKQAIENKIPIDQDHVMTHGEAASLLDFPPSLIAQVTTACPAAGKSDKELTDCPKRHQLEVPHSNYGPYHSGSGERWEFFGVADTLRSLIATKVAELGGGANATAE